MWNLDITEKLWATVSGVDRSLVVKFNNSWVHVATNGHQRDYLMVYRAMVHHPFVYPPPSLPGQSGTPWAGSWRLPIGNAVTEGVVPGFRTVRYFDGVGIAHIRIIDNEAQPDKALKVLSDTIMENTDGFEDPRIFGAFGKYYLHSHRYQPDIARKAPAPEAQVRDRANNVVVPANLNILAVKVNELNVDLANEQYSIGRGCFYGLDRSTNFEKNYGFFESDQRLCAVYGLSIGGQALRILRTNQANNADELFAAAVNGNLQCNITLPDPGNWVLQTETYINEMISRNFKLVMFSSSGPLIRNTANDRWIGVGHVKVWHRNVHDYVVGLSNVIHHISTVHNLGQNPVDGPQAYLAYRADDNFANAAYQYLHANPNSCNDQIGAMFNVAANVVTDEDRQAVERALQRRFLRNTLVDLVEFAYALPQGHVSPWGGGDELPNPYLGDEAIFHPDCFYLSFFYELASDNYRLLRLSNAFLVQDANRLRFLQFAENLSLLDTDLVMGFGEDDNRVKLFRLTAVEYGNEMVHDAGNFAPQNFQFRCFNVAETMLT